MTKNKKSSFDCINPIVWIRKISSFFLSCLLLFKRFFVLFLLIIIALLCILFMYDRYAARTYDSNTTGEIPTASYGHSFAYKSPLEQSNKSLSSDLASVHIQDGKRENIQENRPVVEKKQSLQVQSQEQPEIKDLQPIWNKEDNLDAVSIHQEVKNRLEDIKNNVKERQK